MLSCGDSDCGRNERTASSAYDASASAVCLAGDADIPADDSGGPGGASNTSLDRPRRLRSECRFSSAANLPGDQENTMPPQYIFVMKDLRKVTPQGKEILKGIWLSFYPGAKIGVLGANGAGKSTLLRIM